MSVDDAFVGIDLGTSGVRAVAIDLYGNELAATAHPLPGSVRDGLGGSEQDPGHWWSATIRVLRQLTERLVGCAVRVIAVDGASATLLLCTKEGRPLTPALMYDDQRAGSVLPVIGEFVPMDGAVHSASSSLAKLLFLSRQTVLGAEVRAVHQADWILGKLSSSFGISDENNCLKLGCDAAVRQWPDWVSQLPVPERPGDVFGR